MSVAAIVIAKNEQEMLANCLDTLGWCDEVIVIDHASTDSTSIIAKQHRVKLHKASESLGFAELRELGRSKAQSDWLLYIDADERITPKLKRSILEAVSSEKFSAYSIKRNNIHYGKWMQFGGWENDYVARVFSSKQFHGWKGSIHEHPEFEGELGVIEEPLVHLTHRNLWQGLAKSQEWTKLEAELFIEAGHPKLTTLRFLKILSFDFFNRFIIKKAWKDGVEGTIEAIVQTINRFFVYQQVWELQRKPTLEKTYQAIDKEIADQWQKHDR